MKVFPLILTAVSNLQGAIFFQADLRPDQVVPLNGAPSPAGISDAWATARFELNLNPAIVEMSYEITFHQIDLSEITGIHFHFGHSPNLIPTEAFSITTKKPTHPLVLKHEGASGPNGPHLLNVFGAPREDDADLVVDFENNSLSGIWDNSDVNLGDNGVRDPGDSVAIGSVIDLLLAEEVYVQVHSSAFPAPNTGELRGQVLQIPEPNSFFLTGIALLALVGHRKRTA